MRVWSFRLAGIFLTLSLLVIGTGIALADQDVKIEMADFKFNPGTATLRAGEKVNFALANVGERPHNLRIQIPGGQTVDVASANVASKTNATGSYTFAAPGTYTFWCPVGNHRAQGMEGTFQVTGVAGAAAGGTLPRSGGLPMDLVGGGLAGLAALSFGAGVVLRRRS